MEKFMAPYRVRITLHPWIADRRGSGYTVIKNGKNICVENRVFEFDVHKPLPRKEIKSILQGTKGIEAIEANYEFTEDMHFPGISNRYIPFKKAEICSGRRVGNTTRCVDAAIQILFDEGKVLLVDHHEEGRHKLANLDMQKKVRDRLRFMNLPVVKIDDLDVPKNQPYVQASGARNTFNGLWIKLINS